MISTVPRPVFTKSSAFSLLSTATATTVNSIMQKKKVTRNFRKMYQSSFFMKHKGSEFPLKTVKFKDSFGVGSLGFGLMD